MNITLAKFSVFILCLCGCTQLKQNVIAFSCIKCSGCVVNNLNYIKEKDLDKRFKIIVDTTCYEDQMYILKDINFQHKSTSEIEKEFGRFGNFILIDSMGRKTEFMTDMNLADYLK